MIFYIALMLIAGIVIACGEAYHEKDFPRRTVKFVAIFAVLLLFAFPIFGQSSYYSASITTVAKNAPSGAQVPVYAIPFAKIQVCNFPATPVGSTCTNTVSVYSDQALTMPLTQPFSADAQGQFGFWTASGSPLAYSVQSASGAYLGTYTVTIGLPGPAGSQGSAPPGIPKQLFGFSGPQPIAGITAVSVGYYGIGDPSDVITIGKKKWVCAAAYPDSGFHSQDIVCWSSDNIYGKWVAYSGNPVVHNDQTAFWRSSCIEGPGLNISEDGSTVFMNLIGFNTNTPLPGGPTTSCDGKGTGTIGIVSTSTANFPASLSALPSQPNIPMPSGVTWIYRADVASIKGKCYILMNSGDASQNNVLSQWNTNGTCGATEQAAGAWTYQGVVATDGGQPFEGTGEELQDPQWIPLADGTYLAGYGVGYYGLFGYLYSLDPSLGPSSWTRLAANPIPALGTVLFPRWAQDSAGDWVMLTGTNNGTQMSLFTASGAPSGQQLTANGPITPTNPAYIVGPDGTGKWCVNLGTLVPPGTGGGGAGGIGYFNTGALYCLTPTQGGQLFANSATAMMSYRNFTQSGYSAATFLDYAGSGRGTAGYANPSATTDPGSMFMDAATGVPLKLSVGGVPYLNLDGTGFRMKGPVYPDLGTAVTGTNFVCLDTAGKLVKQNTACSGT